MLNLLALFFLGAFAMRSAGCIINDMWDRDFDAQVERTKNRPLASKRISMMHAFAMLGLLLLGALIILLQLRAEVFWFALASLPLVAIYPLMKRITWWPQAFLGLTFNFGALMGWVAVTGTLELPAILLYLCGIFWTLGYDTIYAFQDSEDDAAIGIKSTALRLQHYPKYAISLFFLFSYAFFCASLINTAFSMLKLIALIAVIMLFINQIIRFNAENSARCLQQFKQHNFIGFSYLVAIYISYFSL